MYEYEFVIIVNKVNLTLFYSRFFDFTLWKNRKAERTVHQVEDLDGQVDQHEVREVRGRRHHRQTGAATASVHTPVLGEGAAARENGGCQLFILICDRQDVRHIDAYAFTTGGAALIINTH